MGRSLVPINLFPGVASDAGEINTPAALIAENVMLSAEFKTLDMPKQATVCADLDNRLQRLGGGQGLAIRAHEPPSTWDLSGGSVVAGYVQRAVDGKRAGATVRGLFHLKDQRSQDHDAIFTGDSSTSQQWLCLSVKDSAGVKFVVISTAAGGSILADYTPQLPGGAAPELWASPVISADGATIYAAVLPQTGDTCKIRLYWIKTSGITTLDMDTGLAIGATCAIRGLAVNEYGEVFVLAQYHSTLPFDRTLLFRAWLPQGGQPDYLLYPPDVISTGGMTAHDLACDIDGNPVITRLTADGVEVIQKLSRNAAYSTWNRRGYGHGSPVCDLNAATTIGGTERLFFAPRIAGFDADGSLILYPTGTGYSGATQHPDLRTYGTDGRPRALFNGETGQTFHEYQDSLHRIAYMNEGPSTVTAGLSNIGPVCVSEDGLMWALCNDGRWLVAFTNVNGRLEMACRDAAVTSQVFSSSGYHPRFFVNPRFGARLDSAAQVAYDDSASHYPVEIEFSDDEGNFIAFYWRGGLRTELGNPANGKGQVNADFSVTTGLVKIEIPFEAWGKDAHEQGLWKTGDRVMLWRKRYLHFDLEMVGGTDFNPNQEEGWRGSAIGYAAGKVWILLRRHGEVLKIASLDAASFNLTAFTVTTAADPNGVIGEWDSFRISNDPGQFRVHWPNSCEVHLPHVNGARLRYAHLPNGNALLAYGDTPPRVWLDSRPGSCLAGLRPPSQAPIYIDPRTYVNDEAGQQDPNFWWNPLSKTDPPASAKLQLAVAWARPAEPCLSWRSPWLTIDDPSVSQAVEVSGETRYFAVAVQMLDSPRDPYVTHWCLIARYAGQTPKIVATYPITQQTVLFRQDTTEVGLGAEYPSDFKDSSPVAARAVTLFQAAESVPVAIYWGQYDYRTPGSTIVAADDTCRVYRECRFSTKIEYTTQFGTGSFNSSLVSISGVTFYPITITVAADGYFGVTYTKGGEETVLTSSYRMTNPALAPTAPESDDFLDPFVSDDSAVILYVPQRAWGTTHANRAKWKAGDKITLQLSEDENARRMVVRQENSNYFGGWGDSLLWKTFHLGMFGITGSIVEVRHADDFADELVLDADIPDSLFNQLHDKGGFSYRIIGAKDRFWYSYVSPDLLAYTTVLPLANEVVPDWADTDEIQAVETAGRYLYVFGHHHVFIGQGSPTGFRMERLSSDLGVIGPDTTWLDGDSVGFWSQRGPALVSPSGLRFLADEMRCLRTIHDELDYATLAAMQTAFLPGTPLVIGTDVLRSGQQDASPVFGDETSERRFEGFWKRPVLLTDPRIGQITFHADVAPRIETRIERIGQEREQSISDDLILQVRYSLPAAGISATYEYVLGFSGTVFWIARNGTILGAGSQTFVDFSTLAYDLHWSQGGTLSQLFTGTWNTDDVVRIFIEQRSLVATVLSIMTDTSGRRRLFFGSTDGAVGEMLADDQWVNVVPARGFNEETGTEIESGLVSVPQTARHFLRNLDFGAPGVRKRVVALETVHASGSDRFALKAVAVPTENTDPRGAMDLYLDQSLFSHAAILKPQSLNLIQPGNLPFNRGRYHAIGLSLAMTPERDGEPVPLRIAQINAYVEGL